MPVPAALIKYFYDLRDGYKDAEECKILKKRPESVYKTVTGLQDERFVEPYRADLIAQTYFN